MAFLISVSGNPRLTHSHDPAANPSQPKQLSTCQSLAVVSNEAETGHSLSISLHPQETRCAAPVWKLGVARSPKYEMRVVMEETPDKLSPAPTLAPSPCRALLTRHLLQAAACLPCPEQLT